MIDKTVLDLLNSNAQNKGNYLTYLNNLDSIYDIEFVQTLFTICKLQKESLESMMNLLSDKYTYLQTITYTTKIIIEKYNGENNTVNYYVFPQITPNIPDGDKMVFARAGMWFKDDKMAIAFAEALKVTYNGEIVKTIV